MYNNRDLGEELIEPRHHHKVLNRIQKLKNATRDINCMNWEI